MIRFCGCSESDVSGSERKGKELWSCYLDSTFEMSVYLNDGTSLGILENGNMI